MSLRFFEGQDHAKVYAKFRPNPPQALIQRLVEFLREKYNGPLDFAVDLGCGNGQCTFTLANDFSSVLGTDISSAQIEQAKEFCTELKCPNVKFEAYPAETIPVPDKSVQLITICEAAHWMDLPKVYEEGKRVLVKNGVFSIVGYTLPRYSPNGEPTKADAIFEAVDGPVSKRLEKYWQEEHMAPLREYVDVTIPFSDFTRERGFPYNRPCKISDILGCIRSYSPYQHLVKAEGEQAGNDLLEGVANKIISILNEGRGKPLTDEEVRDYEFTATFNYFVLMARI